ncbi:MAG: hypothetical protein ACI81T_002316 [Bacteroidia bacterium]|jgi:uncharacterized protein (DUF1684 family)
MILKFKLLGSSVDAWEAPLEPVLLLVFRVLINSKDKAISSNLSFVIPFNQIHDRTKKFKGLDYFPINQSYKVEAKFTRTPDSKPFKMQTSTSRAPVYQKYGEVEFELNGKTQKLNLYQSHGLREKEEYKNYLFIPFYDLTNSFDSYGGGRYIDLEIPEGEIMIIDFNKAYNPYCAYGNNYSCPIANRLKIKVEAGVKAWKKD